MCKKNYNINIDIALFITRLGIGGLMLLHGLAKLSNGIEGLKPMLVAKNLPEILAYGVYVGELIIPIMLILGLAARPAAIIFIINLLFAVGLAHSSDIWKLSPTGGWALELIGLYIIGALVILFAGPGRFSIPCPLCKLLKKKCNCSSKNEACSNKAEK